MNKIKVVKNNIIPLDISGVLIDNNIVSFTENGNYVIEYIDSSNINFIFNIAKNVCVNLFEYSNNSNIIFDNTYNLDRNANLILNKFYSNNSTDESISINLNKEKASVKYNFSSISNNLDRYKINIYHNDKETNSDIYNKTIARENSSNIFDINSFVNNRIKNCNLKQNTKIITLGNSSNKINPNMFIKEISTTASHSSIIGSISENDLFYLMCKGIDYETSIKLIIKGIILSNINAPIEYREKILNILNS